MRKIVVQGAAAVALIAAVGACKKSGANTELKQGQVVATVDGKEITISELNAELEGVNLPDEKARQAARQQALQALITRTILTDIARDRKLDQTPLFLAQKRRLEENLLTDVLKRQIASKVTPPSKADAQAYMTANPDLFANRKVYLLDQIAFAPPSPQFAAQLQPLKTMGEVEQKMIENRVQYKRADNKFDPLSVPPELFKKIAALPPSEIFVLPANGALVASAIKSTEAAPFSGDAAVNYALNYLQNQRVEQALERELKGTVEEKRKTVKYQPGFAPPAAPGAPAAPAAK